MNKNLRKEKEQLWNKLDGLEERFKEREKEKLEKFKKIEQ